MLLHEALELGLRDRADLRRDRLPVAKQHQRRDAAYAVAPRHLRVLVGVELRDLEPARVFAGEPVDRRADRAARSAPFGPVVDEDRHGRREDFLLERGVGDVLRRSCHGELLSLEGVTAGSLLFKFLSINSERRIYYS